MQVDCGLIKKLDLERWFCLFVLSFYKTEWWIPNPTGYIVWYPSSSFVPSVVSKCYMCFVQWERVESNRRVIMSCVSLIVLHLLPMRSWYETFALLRLERWWGFAPIYSTRSFKIIKEITILFTTFSNQQNFDGARWCSRCFMFVCLICVFYFYGNYTWIRNFFWIGIVVLNFLQ